ncbi:MAG: alpha/beta fold hydrolase [Moheibacter sp.]
MLHYKIEGKGNSIVFLHGYLENLKMWSEISKEFVQHYQVVQIDLPGHGKSPCYKEIHTMEFMAEKVVEVLTELHIKEALFVGHSMGGYVTLAMAELFPQKVKAFLLLNSTTLPDSEEKKKQRLKAVEVAQKNLDTLIKMSVPSLFAEQNLKNLKGEIAFTKELARETPVRGVTAALKGMRLRPNRMNVLHDFQGKRGLVMGKFDKAVSAEMLKRNIPNHQDLSVWELETGHMSLLESPLETRLIVQEFFQKVFG